MENEQELYVGVKDKRELRRNILEASKSIVMSMQSYQRLKDIQEEKLGLKQRLKSDVKELKMLFNRLKRYIPEKNVKTNKGTKARLPKLPEIKDSKKSHDQEIDNLHQQLANIEQKLAKF
ncbi:hypothetical protein GOV08_03055 [Candidatus Woesearchaeota archaeon]|nr:hypothetical protein [Candidatus Woesearchaeota archaeon]